jgi:NAD dependent epimerase/dehydratase family enzyme
MELPFRFFAGGTMGEPDQWVSWIHIDDEVGLLLYALDHDTVRGPVNATAPYPVTMEIFSRELGQALGRPSWVPMMAPMMRLVLGERAQAIMASLRVLPKAAEAAGYQFRHTDSAEALRSILAT